MPATITLRQTHPVYAFHWHDEKSTMFSRKACVYQHAGKKRTTGFVIGLLMLMLMVLLPVFSRA
jgi:hypothetical protein